MDHQPIASSPGATPAAYVAFCGDARLVAGPLADVAVVARAALEGDPAARVLVFDQASGAVMDLDLRGTDETVAARYAPSTPAPAARGRPKLGVVAREVTLLPRHWEWLARQPGGASITLRRLVEAARRAEAGAGVVRERAAAAYRFMLTMAGDLPGFEAAARAVFAGDQRAVAGIIAPWPPDIAAQTLLFLSGAPGGE